MENFEANAQAEVFKNKGNDEFKLGNYEAAIGLYTEAISKYKIFFIKFNIINLIFDIYIDTQPNEPAYYTNRAIAYLKQENYTSAMIDCKMALRVNP